MAEKFITFHRLLAPEQLAGLQDNTTLLQDAFPGIQLQWRPAELAGVDIITRGEYGTAIHSKRSVLKPTQSVSFAKTLNEVVIPKMPTEHAPMKDLVLGEPHFTPRDEGGLNLAYFADHRQLSDERKRLIEVVDTVSHIRAYWPYFFGWLIVASIDQPNANADVLDAFNSIKPAGVTLQPVVALAH